MSLGGRAYVGEICILQCYVSANISGMSPALRPWKLTDAAEFHAGVVESAEHLAPFMPWARDSAALSLADRLPFLEKWIDDCASGADFHYGLFEGDRLLTVIGLHPRIEPGGLEIGYWCRASEARKGYTTEAVIQAMRIAFAMPEVTHVEIKHDLANIPSGRIPEKLGFTKVAEETREILAQSETGRGNVWRLTRAEYLERF